MHRADAAFAASIADARNLSALYDFLTTKVPSPFSYDDLLRSQVVYAVGALDKLLHELIRIGMVGTYMGTRAATPKYRAEGISMDFHGTLVAATIAPSLPPKEILFEQEIAKKLKILSFQDPSKIADGLAYIWDEKDKWVRIAAAMALPVEDVKTKLKLIVARRNEIVHESDSDPLSTVKRPITRAECDDITDFIRLCGHSIVALVR